jgi:hypothetical protein
MVLLLLSTHWNVLELARSNRSCPKHASVIQQRAVIQVWVVPVSIIYLKYCAGVPSPTTAYHGVAPLSVTIPRFRSNRTYFAPDLSV